jgi:hypothetical protein
MALLPKNAEKASFSAATGIAQLIQKLFRRD